MTAKKKSAAKASSKSKQGTESVSSMDVSLGHLFSIKPRINSSFRRDDFNQAKIALKDEVYPDLKTAIRAVAAEALSLTRSAASGPAFLKRG
ncbi:MAG: hypothetical protein VCB25_09220 [Myxococcota bacterium]